jgi:hypothetical protein
VTVAVQISVNERLVIGLWGWQCNRHECKEWTDDPQGTPLASGRQANRTTQRLPDKLPRAQAVFGQIEGLRILCRLQVLKQLFAAGLLIRIIA